MENILKGIFDLALNCKQIPIYENKLKFTWKDASEVNYEVAFFGMVFLTVENYMQGE